MRRRSRRGVSLAAAALAIASLLLAGTAQAAPTRAEYVAQLEPICQQNTETNARILDGVRRKIKAGKLRPAGRRFLRAEDAFSSAVDQLAAVGQPSADTAVLGTWFGYLRTEASLLGKIGKALRSNRLAKAQAAFVRLRQNGNVANDTVIGFGFDHCLIKASRFS